MEERFETMPEGSGSLTSPIRSTFSQIRRNLDAGYSYLIFENTSQLNEKKDFDRISELLADPDAGVQAQAFYRDPESGRLLLVARLSVDSDEIWKERMVTEDLPKRINFYFYGKSR